MARVLIVLPQRDYDPTEAGVPWQLLERSGHQVSFATPDGQTASADPRVLSGNGFGIWRPLLMADARGRLAHQTMINSPAFARPLSYQQIDLDQFDGLLFPGGHAPGMKPYLESTELQQIVRTAFERRLPIGAICHGVLVLSRSKGADGRSLLCGRKVTALTRFQELAAWLMTGLWLGSYYRTYPTTVQSEVSAALARPGDFSAGPLALRRDDPQHLGRGFCVIDGHLVTARWPGDAHRFAAEFAALLDTPTGAPAGA